MTFVSRKPVRMSVSDTFAAGAAMVGSASRSISRNVRASSWRSAVRIRHVSRYSMAVNASSAAKLTWRSSPISSACSRHSSRRFARDSQAMTTYPTGGA